MQLSVHNFLIWKALLQISVKEIIIKISQETQRNATTLSSSVATELQFR